MKFNEIEFLNDDWRKKRNEKVNKKVSDDCRKGGKAFFDFHSLGGGLMSFGEVHGDWCGVWPRLRVCVRVQVVF